MVEFLKSNPALYCVSVEGRVTISPPEVAPLCDGGQLELNCTITGSRLEWRIIPKQNHSQLSAQTYSPTGNQSFQYGDSTITVTRLSHPMQLVSYRLTISPVNDSLNGTEVKCTDLENQESSSTIVNAQGITPINMMIIATNICITIYHVNIIIIW